MGAPEGSLDCKKMAVKLNGQEGVRSSARGVSSFGPDANFR